MHKTFLFLAPGFEEIEAIAPADILRRAGFDLTTVAVGTPSKTVTGAHGISVEADDTIDAMDFSGAEYLVCPGGMPGAANLAADSTLDMILRQHAAMNMPIAALCASPAVVLASKGILSGLKATCYPGFENELTSNGATYTAASVQVDGNVITANGPGSAMAFAYAIVAAAMGHEKAQELAATMQYTCPLS